MAWFDKCYWMLGHEWPTGYEVYDTFDVHGIWYLTAKRVCARDGCEESQAVRVLTHKRFIK